MYAPLLVGSNPFSPLIVTREDVETLKDDWLTDNVRTLSVMVESFFFFFLLCLTDQIVPGHLVLGRVILPVSFFWRRR